MKRLYLSLPKYLNFLIYIFPVTFILGNFFINILIFFVSVLGIIYYKKEIFNFRDNIPLILIFVFFFLIFISTGIESYNISSNHKLVKSVLFFRYLFFLLVLRCMICKGDLNLQRILFSCLIFSSFVSIDVIFQYFTGVDILGYKKTSGFASGVFGEEYVAGGYIQKFSILGFFSLSLLSGKKNYKFFSISLGLLILCFIGTLLSGNRMPTLIFVFFFVLLALFSLLTKINLKTTIIVILVCAGFILTLSNNQLIKDRYISFYAGIPKLSVLTNELKKEYLEYQPYKNSGTKFWHTEFFKKNEKNIKVLAAHTGHTQIYITAIETFRESVFIGRGIKSFRHTCQERVHIPNRMCENHPHHFYLEILNDTGIIGFFILFSSVILMLTNCLKKYFFKKNKISGVFNLAFYGVLFALIMEFFPLRSQGSFFSVWNASYVFFVLGILSGLNDLKTKKFLKKRFNF